MIKKFAAVILSAAVILPQTAAMAVQTSITGVTTDEGIVYSESGKERMILSGYDENGTLQASRLFEAEEGRIIIPLEFAKYHRLRAFFSVNEGVYDFIIEEGSPSATPEVTASPEVTSAPVATATPKPTKTPAASEQKKFPEVYETELEAVHAPALVKQVSTGTNENSEECYYVDVLYQGSEYTLEVDKSLAVSAASDAFAYMTGSSAGALIEGDVVNFAANLQGKINRMGFVYRPAETNIVTDGNDYGTSFEKLITENGAVAGRNGWSAALYGGGSSKAKNQLAFGVVRDKKGDTLILLGPDGSEENAMYVSMTPSTIVYICNMSAKKEISIGNTAGIAKSSIPKADENGNIEYSDSYRTNYALVRTIDGIATDIILYTNYNK